MTVAWLSLSVGQCEQVGNNLVAAATSDPSADLAVEINLATIIDRRHIILGLEQILNYVRDGGATSIAGIGVDLPPN